MPATEKDLAQDAPWKKIQQNTFTRWCNEHLKCVHKQINDLHTDLSDGLRFIALLEVLSQKKMPRKHNARPIIRQMQLENVSVGLEFLEREHIRLVSIDSQAIVDGNLKLILGLVWTLILHYSISVPEWEDEEDTSKKQTPKQRLFGWIQNKLPDIPVRNFSKDWQNGRTLGALVDSCAPGLCPDWETWSEEKPVDNAREAMQQADEWLGVPQVITPEEIVDPNVDEYSVMTYLSQFPKAKLKPGAPLRPKLNPKKARAYGPGVEPSGNVATQPTAFVVETVRAGQGDLSVSVKGPTGEDDEVRVTANNDKNHTYAVEYTPKAVGPHEVMVLFANQHISKSPFHVMVSEPQGDANKVSAAGPGLVSAGVVAGRPTDFNINTTGAGVGDVAVVVKGPKDQPTLVDAALEERGPGMYRCCYKPTKEGPHTVAVSFGGLPIPHSPYTVNVAPASKAIACRATGRGLQAKGVRINEIADFTVLTEGAGSGDLQVTLKKPSGVEEPIKQKTMRDTLHSCEYKPTAVGKHTVSVTWAGQHTPGSPFTVDVGPEAGKQKVRAWGPGLSSGMVGKSSDFVVEAVGTDVGALGFSIEGPSQCTIDCTDVGDGSCDVKYWPTEPGCYGVHVICDDDEIKNSPFIAEIVPVNTAFHPEKVRPVRRLNSYFDHTTEPCAALSTLPCCSFQVRISGKGVEPTGNVVGQPLEFTVDAKDAGKAPLQAFAQDVDGTPVPVKVVDNGDGTYACRYTPQKPIKHTVVVTWGALNVPSSPFRVKVGKGSYPQRVKVSGQGVERTGVKAHEPTSFTVDCSEAGEGDVSVGIKCASGVLGPCEADIDFDIIKNDDDTFLVKYTPLAAGRYTIMVLFADEELPNSPYRIKVDPSHDVHKVKAEGPGVSKTGVQLNQPTQFTVTTKGAGQAKLDVQFTGSTKGNPVRNMSIKDNKDDTHTVAYTPIQQGPMAVAVTYGGDLVPYSPFTVDIAPPVDLGKIQVQGLENKLVVGEEFEFDVNTRGAGGRGKLDVHVVSPSNKPLDCSVEPAHTGNGSTVRFLPKEEGPHRVSMVYDGQLLDDTFTLEAALPPDPKKVRVSGEGLRSGKVGHPAQFSIDTRQAGQGNLSLTVEGPSEAKLECVDNGDGTCSVSYLPVEAGDYLINILFAGTHVPGSPFQATIEPSFDPKKVLVKGEGLKNVKVGDTGSFTLDCSQAGDANLDVKMVSDSGVEADVVTRRQAEGVYAVNYTPVCHGPHTMNVKYGGQSVPTFPARLEVQPSVDTSGIKVFGPGIEKAFCDATTDFSVDASSLTRTGGDDLTASITGPSGVVIDAAVTDKKNGTYVVEYIPFELGKHLVDVMYKEVPVAGSPFPLVVSEGCDPKRVCVSGPGLKSGWTNQTNSFTVETRGAGTGGLGLLIEGPTEAVISCTDNKNGTCLVEYVPQDPGQYEVLVSYGGQPVPGSPFVVPVQDKVNPSKVKVSGSGVEPGVRAGIPQEFVVDASRAGQAPLKVELINPRGVFQELS
uniref:Calponin-homology (CH) domain-containing protein n=1 Tax=Eptatretus burgeri TaxID=7764 RepID=A0A8C4N1W2_EPTBU